MEFSDWLQALEIEQKLRTFLEAKGSEEEFFQSKNVLMPYGNWKDEDNAPGLSKFARDNPGIRGYVQQSPDNMAAMLIFVLMSIQADFQEMISVYPIIIAKLHADWGHKNEKRPLTDKQYASGLQKMQNKVHSMLNVDTTQSDDKQLAFKQPWNLVTMSSIFSWKKDAISQVWTKRDSLFNKITSFIDSNDTVGLYTWLANNVKGLGSPKAGFTVQLCMGKLGCIDVHNINLYSAWAKAKEKGSHRSSLYKKLNPKKFKPNIKGLNNYLQVLDLLSERGIESQQLWDIWVEYVSFNYVSSKGIPSYDTTGRFAGSAVGIDPETNKTPWEFEDLGDIKNRAKPDSKDTYRWGMNPGAGSASRVHRVIGNVRNIKFWNDVLKAAEIGNDKAPDEVRFKDPSYIKAKGDRPHRMLAYIVSDPNLARSIGLSDEYINKALDILRGKGYFKPSTKRKTFV